MEGAVPTVPRGWRPSPPPGRGLTNADIARELFVSEGTVKTHINNLFSKIGVRDRAQAVAYAFRRGLAGD